jgi:hypothetical protein
MENLNYEIFFGNFRETFESLNYFPRFKLRKSMNKFLGSFHEVLAHIFTQKFNFLKNTAKYFAATFL